MKVPVICSTPGGGDTYTDGHGTSSAAILVGNGSLPPASTAQSQTGPVTWFRGGTVADADSLDAAEEELRRASLPTGFARLWATRPSWGMLVLAAPLDPAFPDLGHLSHPRRAGEVLSRCGVLPAVIVMEALRLLGGLRDCRRVGYATSADVTGDTSRVVGYAGMLLR